MTTTAGYDTKPYDYEYLAAAADGKPLRMVFHDFRLGAETARLAEGCGAVCAFVNDQLDRECLKTLAACGVRHVAMRCAGFNNVDLTAARECGLTVTRVPAYSPYAVAEHAAALVLTLNRRIHRAFNRVREQNFSLAGLVGFDLHGKTCGIVGTGKIGRVAAGIFRGFGMRVVAYDPTPQPEWAAAHGVEYLAFDDVLAVSDILSLHLPLTPDTHHLINALKRGHLGGLAIDVYEEEEGMFFEDLSGEVLQDDEFSRLLVFPNVLVTAHQAFLTREALSEIARVTVDNILRGSCGEPFLPNTMLT